MFRMRLERQRRGWTLQQLSVRTGINPGDLSLIEREQIPVFPAWRSRIAGAFRRSEAFLFRRIPDAGEEGVA
jgi:transcriptional regulator with XRE-family HTH domain